MIPVTYIDGPFDGEYRAESGYLFAESFVMFLDADNTLWLEHAEPVEGNPGVYVPGADGGFQIATNVPREGAAEVMRTIYDRLTAMSGWEFLTRVLLRMDYDVEFELA